MYATFFGLGQDPFSIAPDPRYLFMSERHREALAHLLYGLKGGGGFVLLSGEIGTGKTTVCRCFLEQIPDSCNVAYIFNPKLTADELLRSICDEFHIDLPQNATTAKDFIDPLNGFLLGEHAAGKSNVLIIDEAQNLSADVLEQLRLLTNLETNERKLLQIVLIGQPELRRMLARPELEQLAQRVIARFHLEALSLEETGHYIAHRLAVAGLRGASPFDAKAVARVHKLARGVPRRINLLCGRALLGAYASGVALVNRRMVNQAAAEVFGPDLRPGAGRHAGPEIAAASAETRRTSMALAVAAASAVGLVAGAALLAFATGAFNAAAPRSLAAAAPAQPAFSTRLPAGASANESASTPVGASAAVVKASAPQAPAVTAKAPAVASRADLLAVTAAYPATQNQAWQALGLDWNLDLTAAEPCQAALRQQVVCFTSKQASVGLIRELDRPGVVTLFDDKQRPIYAVLSALTLNNATLRVGSAAATQTVTVPLAVLAETWRGDFATLWRAPEGYAEQSAPKKVKPDASWLAGQLAKVPNAGQPPDAAKTATKAQFDAAVQARVYAFQLAHGLTPDGQAGPMTLMQLSRAAGVKEPRLTTGQP